MISGMFQQGFCLVDDFLLNEYYQAIQTMVKEYQHLELMRFAKIGSSLTKTYNPDVRGDKILWLDLENISDTLQDFFKKIQKLKQQFNQHFWLNLSEIEAHFAFYTPGSFYKKHIDQFKNQTTRQISWVYYLNTDWQAHDGGQLKLYQADGTLLTEIWPIGNRLICFRSDLVHEVAVTHQTRYSLVGWMKQAGKTLF